MKTEDGREVEYWDCLDSEELTHLSPDDAVEEWYDQVGSGDLPESIVVHGYARMPFDVDPERILERVLEDLDEEHGDPNGQCDSTTKAQDAVLREAAKTFAAVVVANYSPWACERVTSETVNIKEWVRENVPPECWPETLAIDPARLCRICGVAHDGKVDVDFDGVAHAFTP